MFPREGVNKILGNWKGIKDVNRILFAWKVRGVMFLTEV